MLRHQLDHIEILSGIIFELDEDIEKVANQPALERSIVMAWLYLLGFCPGIYRDLSLVYTGLCAWNMYFSCRS